MITKFNQYKLITEDPDYIKVSDEEGYDMSETDAMPFYCVTNDNVVDEILVGNPGNYHYKSFGGRDDNWEYPGRIWIDGKMLAFWIYPNDILFKTIIHKLEKRLKIKIFNNDWRIEVIDKDGEIKKKNSESEELYLAAGGSNYKIISVDDYTGSENVPEEKQIQHLMNWKEKELAKKLGKIHFGSFGSKLTSWDQPHNIKWRQKVYQEKKEN